MLFKLLWSLFKQLRWILPVSLTLFVGYSLFIRYQDLQQSPLGTLLPKDPVTIDLSKIFRQDATVTPEPTPTTLPDTIKITIATANSPIIITAETATTPEKRDLGLMYRNNLSAYQGMYFVFEYPVQYGFWMKNCEIPLDMIFIDEKNIIVDIKENVPTCKSVNPAQDDCPTYVPKAKYLTVLEVPAGTSKTNSIQIGNSLTISN